MKAKVFMVFAAFIVIGCVSVPSPSSKANTLMAGQFLVNVNASGEMSGANRSYKINIGIYFENNQTGKITSIHTQRNGWLLSNKLNGGDYTIQYLYIEHTDGNTVYQMTLNGPFSVTLEEGLVNNIGVVQIDVGTGTYTYQVADYDTVKLDFQNEFPKSEWNSYQWKDLYLFSR